MKIRFLVVGASLTLAACSESPAPATEKPSAVAPQAPPSEPTASTVVDDGQTVKIALSGSDQMQYSLSEIKVKAGRSVELTLTHSGKMPAAVMGHNFVLLHAGTDAAAFAREAMSAAATSYIPAAMQDAVLASTVVIGGGETTSVTFVAPAPGTYDYLCSFPGHASIMKGKLIVEG
jgi:azurin